MNSIHISHGSVVEETLRMPYCSNQVQLRTHNCEVQEAEIKVKNLAEEIWNKKRCIKYSYDNFTIPRYREFFIGDQWTISSLQKRKAQLNQTKSTLDNFELDSWHKHTRRINTAGKVISTLKFEYKPEYCSQAWCKFYECLNNYAVIPNIIVQAAKQHNITVPFCSVHLCEAPGAFISALNHFIQTNHRQIEWDWLATTLNPHYEGNDVGAMINEDKLIMNSFNNWTFLKDGTGNIMNKQNIDYLVKKVRERFKNKSGSPLPVWLVTADGSIDCQSNPLEQEKTVAHLHFAEIFTALSILKEGGSFVLKIFTFLECQTISHLQLLSSLFKEVHIFKPATSKEGNSEVYVICLSYIGRHNFQMELELLSDHVDAGDEIFFKRALLPLNRKGTKPLMCRIEEAANFFTGYQMAIIKRNVSCFPNPDPSVYYFHDVIRDEVAQEWVHRYNIKPLPRQGQLFRFNKNSWKKITHVDPRSEQGSFCDKIAKKSAGILQKLNNIYDDIQFIKGQIKLDEWIRSPICGDVGSLTLEKGKPFVNTLSSRFCYGKLLTQRQDLRILIQGKEIAKKIIPGGLRWHVEGTYFCSKYQLNEKFADVLSKTFSGRTFSRIHRLCFRETAGDLLFMEDFERMKIDLKEVIIKITEMDKDESMFLCEFPLLTRLHVGVVYVLSSIFEQTMLCYGGCTVPRGVMFHKFLGIDVKFDIIRQVAQVITDLGRNEESVVLQIIPMNILTSLDNYDDLFKYNLCNTAVHLEEIIQRVKKVGFAKKRIKNQKYSERKFKKTRV